MTRPAAGASAPAPAAAGPYMIETMTDALVEAYGLDWDVNELGYVPTDVDLWSWAMDAADDADRAAALLAEAVEAVKAEILADVRRGVVPVTVADFADLHSFTDANMYADDLVTALCDAAEAADPADPGAWISPVIAIQDQVHEWLKGGGLAAEVTP